MLRACDDPRLLDSLRHNCGPLIMAALEDAEVIEIMLNPDGSLWIERYGRDHEHIGDISPAQGRLILSLTASGLNSAVNDRNPIVEGEFPLDGSRFEGTFPPIVGPGPSFSLRKKASRVFTLAEYLAAGSITTEVVSIIHDAVLRRLNIVVVGGTSSGKTTFVNAVIDTVSRLTPSHRLIILEDTAELQSKSPNTVFFRTSVVAAVDMRALAKVSMRYAPTATGRQLLIPQGSKLFGVYDSRVVYGQERVLVAWNRLVFPDGSAFTLGAMPGSDMAGYAGYTDQVNNHYLRIFGSAVLMSMISGGIAYTMDSLDSGGSSDNPTLQNEMGSALAAQLGQTTMQLLQKNLNIKPTLEIRPGYQFNVIVTKDLVFQQSYKAGR